MARQADRVPAGADATAGTSSCRNDRSSASFLVASSFAVVIAKATETGAFETRPWRPALLAAQRLDQPGIQFVPASGTRAIAAASIVSATRSSGSRLWTCDLPQARASVCVSSVSTRR